MPEENNTTHLLAPLPKAEELFAGDTLDTVITQVKEIVEAQVPDLSTTKGRNAIASLARKVASTKVALDTLGKDLVADWKVKSKQVDEKRKHMRDTLDGLRDYARQPLTDWEAAEAEKQRLAELQAEIAQAEEDAYAEEELLERERVVKEREAELARQEEDRRQKEEAERIARERQEREARIAQEAKEKAEREAAAAILRERQRAEQAERERIAAEERAKIEQERAVKEAEQRAREEAERKERERLAAEQAERIRQEKQAANKKHRETVEREALESLKDAGLEQPMKALYAIKDGKIAHVTLNY